MQSEPFFEGFREHIAAPLESSDKESFLLINRIFSETCSPASEPFSMLMARMTGRRLPEKEALRHWRRILEHKAEIEKKLGRRVGIEPAAIDYAELRLEKADIIIVNTTAKPQPSEQSKEKKLLEEIGKPGLPVEKLKEEMMRSKRYKHALSAILLDVDEFHKINESLSMQAADRILTVIVKIIKKTIRNVDILTRCGQERFLLILPNTNRREAYSLAERLRLNVNTRTSRLEELPAGITITLSAGQCDPESSSSDFTRQLENTLIEGEKRERNKTYSFFYL
ncbi:MAG: GGDEF domain-containing protein [Chitinispirillales bacterium]|jgi:diguanylate cyclase (GGDEF)-like protein|nr:GGDEF domain-containing protein [Chitinispirillales bacterium]